MNRDNLDTAGGRRLRIILAAVVVPMIAATAVALAVLWPGPRASVPSDSEQFGGRVIAVQEEACPATQPTEETPTGLVVTRCGTVDVNLTDGPDAGRIVTTSVPGGPGAPEVHVGDEVVLIQVIDPADESTQTYSIIDHQRATPMLLLAIIFAIATVAFARWRGLAALGGLAVSFAVLLMFIVPAIMDGRPPVPVAIAGAAAIMFAVLYLTHGISVSTTVAVIGTLVSLVLTGVAGTLAASAAHLTGFAGEDASTLAIFYANVDLRGLLLAGIIIGSLGVLDDITVTQAVTVREIAAANPTLSALALYRAAARVGRAHIASVVNTLVLAYAGASLPLFLLISASGSSAGSVITGQLVAQEIVRSLVGSLGLIAAVPITTALAAVLTRGRTAPATVNRPADEAAAEAFVAGRHAISTPWSDPPLR